MEPIKVLIVDDSATVRQVLARELAKDPGINVVGAAPDPFAARELMQVHNPDILTLDLEMPRLDGLSFLKRLMEHRPMPVIVVSSLTPQGSALALQALETGALDVLGKPGIAYGVGELAPLLIARIKSLGRVRVAKRTGEASPAALPGLNRTTNQVLAIGSSTGGTEALRRMLPMLPGDAPGCVIVQHMPPGFTTQFAQRLNDCSLIRVKEAENGDIISPGICLIAPGGDRHLLVRRDGAVYRAELREGPKVGLHRPAVDVLFRSVAQVAGANAIGVLLTGMGRDGADGMKLLQTAKAPTIAQDEASSVVWGMPGEAVKLGAADQVLPLDRIPAAILALAQRHA